MAYAFSDDIKIIDLGSPARSVTTSMVGPTLATAGLLVFVFSKLVNHWFGQLIDWLLDCSGIMAGGMGFRLLEKFLLVGPFASRKANFEAKIFCFWEIQGQNWNYQHPIYPTLCQKFSVFCRNSVEKLQLSALLALIDWLDDLLQKDQSCWRIGGGNKACSARGDGKAAETAGGSGAGCARPAFVQTEYSTNFHFITCAHGAGSNKVRGAISYVTYDSSATASH